MAFLEVVTNAPRQAVEAGRANFIVRPDNDRSDATALLDAPCRQMMRQQHEPLIPFLIAQMSSLQKSIMVHGSAGTPQLNIANQQREHQHPVNVTARRTQTAGARH